MKINDDVLESLRPEPVTLDPTWSLETLARITASETPARNRDQRPARRRAALLGLAVALPLAAGVGVAAADGSMPRAFTDAFSFWKTAPVEGRQGVDPATSERVATAPGPHGTTFTVMSTGDGTEYACRTSLLESPESAAGPGPASFTAISSNFCSSAPLAPTFGTIDVSFVDRTAAYIVSAGGAVRAEVRTEDGHEYPALLVNGDFWGWFPTSARPTLVGYASDGSVVGTVQLF